MIARGDGAQRPVGVMDIGREGADEAGVFDNLGVEEDPDPFIALDLFLQLQQIAREILAAPGPAEVLHLAAEGRLPLDERDSETLPRGLDRRGHPRHPAADDQQAGIDIELQFGQRFGLAGVGHRHPHQPPGLLGGHRRVVGVDPAALVADIGHIEEIFVDPGLPQGRHEQRFMGARRAGGDHQPVETMLADDGPDRFL